jgi:hypothetical protein
MQPIIRERDLNRQIELGQACARARTNETDHLWTRPGTKKKNRETKETMKLL